ncbi:MAG TPA: hypothetical protein DDY52_02635 [Candidatus Moranbacteria bacterium]|nr:MAG: hypothetical protein UR51_C0019G0024 [Candidatus Moranbacteria bacterium GW2011_GWF1_34_10]HBI17025.1 hypothetical protein [Candidatus Moranbacteria bacterium]
MLSFSQSLIIAFISSGFSSLVIGGIFTYFFNKKLSRYEKILEMRKELYTEINETLSGFFNVANYEDRQRSCSRLLNLHRKSQIWASEEVLEQFNNFLFFIDLNNNKSQDAVDKEYRKLIVSMRNCITENKLDKSKIYTLGEIK